MCLHDFECHTLNACKVDILYLQLRVTPILKLPRETAIGRLWVGGLIWWPFLMWQKSSSDQWFFRTIFLRTFPRSVSKFPHYVDIFRVIKI